LIVSALAPYKRVDIAVEAFNRLRLPLMVIGIGPERPKLERRASSSITFLGWQPDAVVREYYRRCEAVIFPGEEDFGIVPVEAQACGKPVIALGKGGSLESIIPLEGSVSGDTPSRAPTGVFFYESTVEALCEAVELYHRYRSAFDPMAMRHNALRFDRPLFKTRIAAFLAAKMGTVIA
jgi:glycosyltransferase involved in cell wall biosynthesis